MALPALGRLHLLVALHHDFGLFTPQSLDKAGRIQVPLTELAREATRFNTALIKRFILVLAAFSLYNNSIPIARYVYLRVFFA